MHAEDDIMAHPTGIGGDALLSTLVNHVASREGVIEAAELDLIFGIVSSLAGRISPDALAMAQAKLSALVTAQEHDHGQHAGNSDIAAVPRDEETHTSKQIHHLNDVEQQPFEAEASFVGAANDVATEPHSDVASDTTCSEVEASGLLLEAMAPMQAWPEPVLRDGLQVTDEVSPEQASENEYHVSFNDILDQPHLDQPIMVSGGLMDQDAPESVMVINPPKDALVMAAICQPMELVALAEMAAPSAQLCNLIVARGHPEALAAIARNPAACFAKSSFTTMVELAASDFSIRQALCSRADLGDMILERLWPYLSQSSRSSVIASGCRDSHVEAVLLCSEVMQSPESDMDEMRSASDWTAAIEAGEETLCQAMRTLDGEGRIVDVAVVLAARSRVTPEIALTMMLGTYDRCAIVLARLAGCDDDSLSSLMHVRGRAGARGTADKRGPLHAFSRMSEDEAIGLARSMERQLSLSMANRAGEKSTHLKGPLVPAANNAPGVDGAEGQKVPIAA